MDWADLGNPSPLPEPKPYAPIPWFDAGSVRLPPWNTDCLALEPFGRLLEQRRTRRTFEAIDLAMLSTFLGVTCRVQLIGNRSLGFPLTLRPTPSAGAIHPIHLLIIGPNADSWLRYDPFEHTLRCVPSACDPRAVHQAMQAVLPAPSATLLLLAAEPGMTASKYAQPSSLVWRDAGVLLGFLAMGAQALDLSFCPLGITGEPYVSRLLDQPGLTGVGGAFVGAAPR